MRLKHRCLTFSTPVSVVSSKDGSVRYKLFQCSCGKRYSDREYLRRPITPPDSNMEDMAPIMSSPAAMNAYMLHESRT